MEFLCEALGKLWQSGRQPPDIFAFVLSYPRTPAQNIIPLLTLDQKYRWQTAKPIRVEEYLEKLPFLRASRQQCVELIFGEFNARVLKPTAEVIVEYLNRFPELQEILSPRFTELARDNNTLEDITVAPRFLSTTLLDGKEQTKPAPKTHSRYEIRQTLGEGDFGRAFLAYDRELERPVVIKFPNDPRLSNPTHRAKYLAESRAVANLMHPHVVPVYDVVQREDGTIYIVSKFIEGHTLEKRIRENLPSYTEGARIVGSIASALEHAHQRQLVHRDVKPGNIFLETSSGTAYMADFGFVFRGESQDNRERPSGTPPYMSPEQVKGDSNKLDARSDIFALGAILYEVLTGQRAFAGNAPKEVFHNVIYTMPPSIRTQNRAIPEELERICCKALAKSPDERYQSASLFAQDLLRWYVGTTASHSSKPAFPDSRNRISFPDLRGNTKAEGANALQLVSTNRRYW